MEWMDKLKSIMYSSDISYEIACDINDVIFKYDEYRAETGEEVYNAGKEWHCRLKKICDYRTQEGL